MKSDFDIKLEAEKRTAAYNLIIWVQRKYPDAIKFNPDRYCEVMMGGQLLVRHPSSYRTFMFMWGVAFILAAIEYYKSLEDYEICGMMIEAIKREAKWLKMDFPMSIHDDEVQDYMKMTPHEIAEVSILIASLSSPTP